MFYKLYYFSKSNTICADDLNNQEEIDTINLNLLSSLSDLKMYQTPFSGSNVKNYAKLTMNNGNIYFIKEKSFSDLTSALNVFSPTKKL